MSPREPDAGWPAIDLTEDASILTAIANDIGTEAIFSRQVIAHGRPGDALLALSTSGNSGNVIHALAEARRRGLVTIAMVGYDGGRIGAEALADHVDHHPLRAHPADPGGAGQRVPCAARAGRMSALRRRARARVQGTVQGVGFRPYVHRLAGELGLTGYVLNDAHGVLLEVEGDAEAVDGSWLVSGRTLHPWRSSRASRSEGALARDTAFVIRPSPRGGTPTHL